VNFGHYTDDSVTLAVDLANTVEPGTSDIDELRDLGDLGRWLADHGLERWVPSLSERDLDEVRGLRSELREVFAADAADSAAAALNRLLSRSEIRPQLSDHDGHTWHLHVTAPEAGVVGHLRAVSALGLSLVLAEHGWHRLGQCAEQTCVEVFVDTSKNTSRRYCSEICANRANVRAFRARTRDLGPGDRS
jgi:predicted RNA-binding Zn ribbon-like protein